MEFPATALPEVAITDITDTLGENDPKLSYALNFAIKDLENLSNEYLESLFNDFGDAYVDYVLTIDGLSDPNSSVTFNADEDANADGYLAGRYAAWENNAWISVPFEDVTIQNGESIYIMQISKHNKSGSSHPMQKSCFTRTRLRT